MEQKAVTVTQLNNYIKNMFGQDFYLNRVSVSGEISNLKYHGSGHIYFTLKDSGGAINGVMFSGDRAGLKFTMKDGDQVVITGQIDVYTKTGVYQIYAKRIEQQGQGNLYLKYEALKAQLEEMGMFSDEYKKPIPRYVSRIGIVTAPTGQAVKDMIKVATERNPHLEITVYPAQVQGDGAKESIVRGIETLDAMGLDVLLVGRGGGSIEDLWAFNEEMVAYAIFNATTPIISAVGHEGDVTIADFVADRRASTPSNAAELAVYPYDRLCGEFEDYIDRLTDLMVYRLQQAQRMSERFEARLDRLSPESRLMQYRQTLDQMYDRLDYNMRRSLMNADSRLKLVAAGLEAASPVKKIAGGYAYIADEDGHGIRSVKDIDIGGHIRLSLADGDVGALVENVTERC